MLRNREFEPFRREPGLGSDDDDDGVWLAGGLAPPADVESRVAALTVDLAALDEVDPGARGPLAAGQEDFTFARAAPQDIDPAQILRDRPDVHAAFYSEFHGPNNDRHSSAWQDRVGGKTAEDYARYWYKAHGQYEGYTPAPRSAAAPAEVHADPAAGRTTIDGIALSQILSDRPDVFQAFFTEYYGPNNDRNSDAWVQRVGGVTVEDYANYWYNAHGKVSGYAPSIPRPAAEPFTEAASAPAEPLGGLSEQLFGEDPSLDPWNHPVIYPDWQPPYPGWRASSVGEPDVEPIPLGRTADPEADYPYARPLVVHFREDGVDIMPATLDEIATMTSLFDDSAI